MRKVSGIIVYSAVCLFGTGTLSAQVPELTVPMVTQDLALIDAAGWSSITGLNLQTLGYPSGGGHGGVLGKLPVLSIKAAHDGSKIYFRFEWADSTSNNVHNLWTLSGGTWSSDGEQDRLYMAFPTVDVPGREGKTFAEAGCAMMCHLRDPNDVETLVPNTTSPIDSCTYCHTNAPDKVANRIPPFVHPEPVTGECMACHGGLDNEPINGGGADMIVPVGGAVDFWHWKAGQSAPLKIAEDQSSLSGRRRRRDSVDPTPGANIQGEKPLYVWVEGNQAVTKMDPIFKSQVDALLAINRLAKQDQASGNYILMDGRVVQVPEGTQVRLGIHNDTVPNDGSFDVKADSRHDGSKWIVVLSRTLKTLESIGGVTAKDYDFRFGVDNLMAMAVIDNGEIDHKGINLIKLRLEETPTSSIPMWNLMQ